MSTSFPVSTPVTFSGSGGALINFNATGTSGQNKIQNFVTSAKGDLIYCISGANNTLGNLPIGISGGQALVVSNGIPTWSFPTSFGATNYYSLTAIKNGANQTIGGTVVPNVANIITGWDLTTSPAKDNFSGTPFNITSGLFTVPATGGYSFKLHVSFTQSNTANPPRILAIVSSPSPGPGTIVASNQMQPPAATTVHGQDLYIDLWLSGGTVLGFEFGRGTTAGNVIVNASSATWLCITRLS